MIELSKLKQIQTEIEDLTKKIRFFSLIRFALCVCAIVCIICLLCLDSFALYLSLSLGFILILIGFAILTNPTYYQLKLKKNLEFIYKRHENRRNLNYQGFTANGRELIHYQDYKELDLDLLGPRSLYQYLCLAKSKAGKEKLAKQLTEPELKTQEFKNCVYALAGREEALQLEASLHQMDQEAQDCDQAELMAIARKRITIPWYGILLCCLSYIALIALAILASTLSFSPYYLLFFIPLNFIIVKKCLKSEVFVFPATRYSNLLAVYQRLAKDILSFPLEDPYFKQIQNTIQTQYASLVKFSRIFEMLSYRKNALLSILGNGIFYLDYLLSLRYNSFSKHLESIEECLDAFSEVELMLSLAVIGMDNEVYSLPVEDTSFFIEEGYHPLVKDCVPNSLNFEKGIILTGSNMSGKTTFMRMLGINQILANAGGIVCAKSFHTMHLDVLTSLRANDMLQEGISTFYAEVNRMKKIMEESKRKKTLVLIDEIFKGTNAKDRIYAAQEIIKKLNSYGVYFLITTHDFELCDTKNIINYHFDEEYIEDKITFDFKLKSGKCQKTNAIYLLKIAGVLDNLEENQ